MNDFLIKFDWINEVNSDVICSIKYQHNILSLCQAVSVGVNGSVWLVSSEGRVYLRQGISTFTPTGLVSALSNIKSHDPI